MSNLERSASESSGGEVRPWEPPAYYGSGYDAPSVTEQFEIALDILQRRKWIILITCALAVAVAIALTYTQETTYTASTLVLISDDATPPPQSAAGYENGEPFARHDPSVESELLLLRNSDKLPRRVANRLIQREVLPSSDRVIPILMAEDSSRHGIDVVTALVRGSVSFEPESQEAKVIRITARSDNREEATLIAGLYLEEYIAHSREASRARITASRQFLEQQAMMRRNELHALEQRIQEFQRQEGSIALDNESTTLANRLAQAEAQRDEAQLELRQREATYESLEEQLAAIRPEQLSERVGSALEQEIQALQTRVAELEITKRDVRLQAQSLSDSDRAYIGQLDNRIDELREEISNLSRRYVDELMASGGLGPAEGVRRVENLQLQMAELRIQMSGLETRINVLTDRIREYEAELSTIPERAMSLAQLQRDRSYEEEMYQYLARQLQEVRIAEESELGYASRVTEAPLSARAVTPGSRRTILLGVFLGLILGVGLALIRDRLDRRLYKPDDLRAKGYSIVCTVPNLKPIIDEQLNGKEVIKNGKHKLSSALVSQTHSLSAAAEAYRSLRTNILFRRDGKQIRTLLITSPGMGDGKSVTAANIGIVMAQTGKRTLLIDADLRRPRQHELFGLSHRPGLSNALKNSSEKSLHIQQTPIENLRLLPSGPAVKNANELLGSDALQDVLRTVDEHFDFIVIDTPPVLASADALLFSTQCDGTLVVARAGATTDAELEHTVQSLEDVGAHVVGTLFNGFDLSMAYGYKLRYRHYTRYGPYGQYGGEGVGDG